MGWLFMQRLDGHAGPRQYLDAQFTFDRPLVKVRVVRSALVAMRTYYAAVERINEAGERRVSAIIALIRYNPRDKEGYIFGYKDMDESVLPYEAQCPTAILDLLSPTEDARALQWRGRCRDYANRTRRPKPRPGDTLVFKEPVRFQDGSEHHKLHVIRNPTSARGIRFSDGHSTAVYAIGKLDRFDYCVIMPLRSSSHKAA